MPPADRPPAPGQRLEAHGSPAAERLGERARQRDMHPAVAAERQGAVNDPHPRAASVDRARGRLVPVARRCRRKGAVRPEAGARGARGDNAVVVEPARLQTSNRRRDCDGRHSRGQRP
jgi:hypothetical protein